MAKQHISQTEKNNIKYSELLNSSFVHIFICISGAIFEQGTDEVQSAFKFAMLNHNVNMTKRRFELQAYVDVINTADAFKLSRLSKWKLKIKIKTISYTQFS